MKPLRDGSAIYVKGLLWLCQHGVGYPDICEQCGTFASEQLKKHLLASLRTAGFPPWWLKSLENR